MTEKVVRVLELIALHAAIFACVAVALVVGLLIRSVFHWLQWNWRRFDQEIRRPVCIALSVLTLSSASGAGPPANRVAPGEASPSTGSVPSDAESSRVGDSPAGKSHAAETDAAVVSGSQWPAFRGVGTSLTAANDLPLSWSDESGIRWQVELPGYGQSSPVVWGNRVFVTTMQGENKETPTVLCLDLRTGRKLWQRELVASQTAAVSNYASRGAPTPAVDEERVYAFFESGDLFVFDHGGNVVWSRSLVHDYGPIEGNHGIGSSVARTRENVIVLMNHAGPSFLLALDKRTGETSWRAGYEKRVAWSSPIVCEHAGRELILMSGAGRVEAYDAGSGQRLWQLGGFDGNNVPSPTPHGATVIIGSTERASNVALQLPSTGGDEQPTIRWKADGPSCSFGSPLVHRGYVYFVNTAGVAFCVALQTGDTQWKERLGDSCWASPLGVGERVYFFTKGGSTVVVRAAAEWIELARNELTIPPGAKVYGVAAVDGAILIRTGSRLYCVGPS